LLRSLPGKNAARTAGQADTWRRTWRHLGSTVALIVGCLAVIGGFSILTLAVDISRVDTFAGDALMGGAVMILGSLAYRSAKKQKLGEVNSRRVSSWKLPYWCRRPVDKTTGSGDPNSRSAKKLRLGRSYLVLSAVSDDGRSCSGRSLRTTCARP
jgi:hypothetical protein